MNRLNQNVKSKKTIFLIYFLPIPISIAIFSVIINFLSKLGISIMFFRKFSILLFLLSMMILPITHAADLQKVDINTANAQTLARVLKGIGPKKAAAIVVFRKKNGPFKAISDLDKVRGIGKKIIEKNKGKIILSKPKVSKKSSKGTRNGI